MSDRQRGMDTVIRQAKGPVFTEVDGEVVLMSVESGKYYVLNPMGSRIWSLAAEPIRLGDLCARLIEEYDVGQALCETEVLGYVRELADRRLIEAT